MRFRKFTSIAIVSCTCAMEGSLASSFPATRTKSSSPRRSMPSIGSWIFGRTERALAAAILITVVILSLSSPYFLTVPNGVNLIEAYSVPAILAAGVLVVLVCGGIDISFTATAAAVQYFAATLATKYGMPLVPTLIVSACLGIGLGSF